ncbi:SDR family NAD(P)-dependent oxidoreductase [Rhizosaccharibacter radicis]|uniref:SDR family oxidoreductase n=1 Tax=Rhizosaccharibacter radicis TaxID=2782605 RepID=A0ABT1W0V0_9PROT|nr:SDR family oxidoreductase [Acetobacteraceae bacterium KSS12]
MVTGAARGIGETVARFLGRQGATVVLTDLNPQVEETARGLAADGIAAEAKILDVTDNAAVMRAAQEIGNKHGHVDALVANAGISLELTAIEHDVESWRRVMALNLDAVFFTAQAFARPMLARGSGSIVMISSISGVGISRPERHVSYDVSKAGVAHMARSLGVEWAKQGVRVNAVGPGYTDTQMLAEVGRAKPEVLQAWLSDIPTGRLLRREEIASAVAFLLSDAASGMTGHLMMVDHGYSVGKGV